MQNVTWKLCRALLQTACCLPTGAICVVTGGPAGRLCFLMVREPLGAPRTGSGRRCRRSSATWALPVVVREELDHGTVALRRCVSPELVGTSG